MRKPKKMKKDEVFEYYRTKYYSAYAQMDETIYDQFELTYRGSHVTTANVNSTSKKLVQKTNNVFNVTYEMIESKVNTDIPDPVVTSQRPGFESQARMIQDKIFYDVENCELDRIADKSERNTYVLGMDVLLLSWDFHKGAREYSGEKKFVQYHAKQVIPQPNVYDERDMEYIFFVGSRTKEGFERQYGVNVDSESEERPEVNRIAQNESDPSVKTDDNVTTDEMVTEVICFYLDEDNDICKLVWAGSTLARHYKKYFYPRVNVCSKCDAEYPQDEEKCPYCDSEKHTTKAIMEETIEEDMELEPISYPKQKKVVMDDGMGNKVVKEITEQVVIERKVPKGTKIPIPAPKRIPVCVRRNIPLNFSFRGRSDAETIHDQQESIKKALSKAEEKILNAPVLITVPNNLKTSISNDTYQIISGNLADLDGIGIKNLQASIDQDIAFVNQQYNLAKSSLGITDSFQGKYDPSAKSGKAKQIQVEQAAGRLQGPIRNKFLFYSDIFKLMYMFDMCFTKKPRYYSKKNLRNDTEYCEFNRYELLMQDDAGEWYFNTDFIFSSELANNFPRDKGYLYEKVIELAQYQAIDQQQTIQLLGKLNFPFANELLDQIAANEAMIDEATQVLAVIGEMARVNPQQAIQFLSLPVEEQRSMINEMIGGKPDEMQSM